MTEKMDTRVAQYIAVRDKLKEIDKEYEESRKPLLEIQERLTGIIRSFMEQNNLENLKTKSGTAYTSTRYTATVADGEAFMEYVKRSQNWDLIERRASATAVRDYVKKHNTLPAGCNLNAIQTVGVRKPTS